MKSDCTTQRATTYSYPFTRVACEAPASAITDTDGVGATPKILNKSVLFNLLSPLWSWLNQLQHGANHTHHWISFLAWDMHWKAHSSTCANVKDRHSSMLCFIGHWSKALSRQYHGRQGNDYMRRFGEQNFFRGGTPFRWWICREILMKSAQRNPLHISEVNIMIAALTDLLKNFTIIRAQIHLKILQ